MNHSHPKRVLVKDQSALDKSSFLVLLPIIQTIVCSLEGISVSD
jgi:hypothetical protein